MVERYVLVGEVEEEERKYEVVDREEVEEGRTVMADLVVEAVEEEEDLPLMLDDRAEEAVVEEQKELRWMWVERGR